MQLLAAFDDIAHHVVEKLEDVEQIGIAPLEFLDEMAHGEAHRLAAGLLDADLHLPPPLRELVHQLVQALAVLLDQLADAGLLLVGKLFEILRPHRFLALDGSEDEAVGRAQQGDALLARLLPQLPQRTLLAFLEFLLDGLEPDPVFLALEGCADGLAKFIDELLHVAHELAAAAGRNAQQARFVRIGKVVDIAPVARRRLAGRLRLEQATHRSMAAAARVAEHEEIESGLLDVDAETHRIERARLADDIRGIVQFLCRLEVQQGGIATAQEPLRLDRGNLWHSGFSIFEFSNQL